MTLTNLRTLTALAIVLWALAAIWAPSRGLGQTLVPDGDNLNQFWHSKQWSFNCQIAACQDDVDEAVPRDAYWNWASAGSGDNRILYQMQDPASDPDTARRAQGLDLYMAKCQVPVNGAKNDTGTDPTYDVEVWCQKPLIFPPILKSTLATGVSVGGEELHSYTFTYTPDADCDAAGANLEVLIRPHWNSTNDRLPCVDAVHWRQDQHLGVRLNVGPSISPR